MAEAVHPADFWRLLVASRLLTAEDLAAARSEFADRTPDAVAIATWLGSRGLLTAWQARQLLRGRGGPFFLGDYRLLEQRKTPHRGRLFSARHQPTGREVAVVVLETEACDDPATWESIVRATQLATQVSDPVVSKTWALEQADRRRLVVCEAIAGASLGERFSELGTRPLAETGRIVFAVARAIAELHRLGIVHGAVSLHTITEAKPDNAGSDGPPVRLLQFPLAGEPHVHPPRLPLEDPRRLEALGQRICFAAPELATPGATATATSDVYALGCVLAALLTGRLPNWDGTVSGTLARTQQAGLQPLPRGRVPAEVATAIDYMTAADPLQRYASAVEAAAAVAACFGLPEFPLQPPATAPVASDETAVPSLVMNTDTASATTATRRRRRTAAARSRRWQTVAMAVLALVVAVGGAAGIWLAVQSGSDEQPVVQGPDGGNDIVGEHDPLASDRPDEPAAGRRQQLVDDPSLPWASPTTGGPPAVEFLPQGSQLMLLARPAELFADAEGRRFIQALGPQVKALLDDVERLSGTPPSELVELRIGWATTAAGEPVVGIVLIASDVFAETAGTSRELAGETIYDAPEMSLWRPTVGEGRVLVIGPRGSIEESIASAGVPLLAPDVERLIEALDGARQLILIGSPSFLRNDGQLFLPEQLAAPAAAIAALLGERTTVAAASLFLGETCYVEVDAVPVTAEPPRRLVDEMASRLGQLPDDVEQHCLDLAAGGYGGRLIGRLPGMLRVVAAELRWGVEDGLAVLNAHLPREAAHNLALASELALAQKPGTVAVAKDVAQPQQPQSLEAKLAQNVSLVFARDTLEKSIEMLSAETDIPMEILGADLQLEGITKNQSFGLDQQDQPVAAILRTILGKANPDGKLVYVIRGEGAEASLAITTRAAAAKRGEALPAGFEQP